MNLGTLPTGAQTIEISLSGLPAGMYFASVNFGRGFERSFFDKQNLKSIHS
jgi:hypothetical protein